MCNVFMYKYYTTYKINIQVKCPWDKKNSLPFLGDDTRVILKVGKGSDYINANYIEVSLVIF